MDAAILEAGAGVAVAAAPHAQLQLVGQGELDHPGDILDKELLGLVVSDW